MSFADRSLSGSAYTGSSSSQSTRQGSTDPYALSRLRHDASEHQRTADLTAEALERLRVSDDPHPLSGAGRQTRGQLRRQASLTPSVTSVSTGPEEEDGRPSSRQTERYIKDQWLESGQGKGKGKGKEREDVQGTTVHDLPGEVLISIFSHLSSERDALSCIKVCRQWCELSYPVLWQRPVIRNLSGLASLARVLLSPYTTQPYAESIRRINLTSVTDDYGDEIFESLSKCIKAERMTLGPTSITSPGAMCRVFRQMPNLVSVDLSSLVQVNDEVIKTLAGTCPKTLQGLNINGCRMVGDEAVCLLAEKCHNLRRLKVNGCIRLTDKSLVAIARSCLLLVEVDIADLAQATSATVYALLLNTTQLRELKVTRNQFIDSEGFPDLPLLTDMDDRDSELAARRYPVHATTKDHDPESTATPRMLMPRTDQLTQLRTIDLTDCPNFTDAGLANLISSAPRIRALTLAKCVQLTDEGLKHVAQLGGYLHHLHIAHVSLATDAAVTEIARACKRLRYVDFACCPLLTDMSVFELAANIPKLKRVGLVKVLNITDQAIYHLVERSDTLERLHLSYCDKLTVPAITYLLNKLPRLTHLSLTGVSSFRTPELQAFCRPAPKVFSDHQIRSFCVFSGNGIAELRKYLNASSGTSDDGSNRRDSDSSTESATLSARYSTRYRTTADPSISSAMGPAFASLGPNFLAPPPTPALPTRRIQARQVDRSTTADPSSSAPYPNIARSLQYTDSRSSSAGPSSAPPIMRRGDGLSASSSTSRAQNDPHGPVEFRYISRQSQRQPGTQSQANEEWAPVAGAGPGPGPEPTAESEWERSRWIDVPAAYVRGMMRAAGLRRQRDMQGETSTRSAERDTSPRGSPSGEGRGNL